MSAAAPLSSPNRQALATRIIVAIPVLNEAAHIQTCVTELMAGDPALACIELIIADGGSTDGTQAIVTQLQEQWPNIQLRDNPKRLQAAAVNLVANNAPQTRDILIRCDAHASYPENYLLNVAAMLLAKGCDSLVVPMDARVDPLMDTNTDPLLTGSSCVQKANAWIVDTPLGSGGSAHRGGTASAFVDHGHHAAFRRDRFVALGGYDERFSHNEDAEYDARLRQAGGKIWLAAELRIGYYPRATIAGLWRQYCRYGQGRARNVRKNRLTPRLRQLAPVVNLGLLVISALALGVTPLGWVYPLFYLGVLGLTSAAMALRQGSLCGLWAGVCIGVMHLAWGSGFVAEMVLGQKLVAV